MYLQSGVMDKPSIQIAKGAKKRTSPFASIEDSVDA